MVDATAGGSLVRRTPKDAYGLLDDMSLNAFSWNIDRSARKPSEIHSISTQAALAAQVEALQRQLNQINAPQQQLLSCELCGGDHDSVDCTVNTSPEQANFMGNFQGGQNNFQRPMQNQFQNRPQNRFSRPQANPQNDPYAPTYNPGWRQHPNFSYKNPTQIGRAHV